jgi:hypothetical protein
MISVLMIGAPAVAQTPSKWIKGAPFPEPSEELVGGSVGGKFYVFGGLRPGWIPQGLVYEYDPATDKWTKKKPMALPAHHVAFAELNGKSYAFGSFVPPGSNYRPGYRSTMPVSMTQPTMAGGYWHPCRRNGARRLPLPSMGKSM